MNIENKKILVTGGNGFLGGWVVKKLLEKGVVRENIKSPHASECDLRVWENCKRAVSEKDIVIHLAAKVGGIGFNQQFPGELFYDNIIMGTQLMEASRQAGVEKFVGLATICAYPKFAPIPFKEDDIWNGYPEETNAPYGLAKKMMLVQAQAYRQQYGYNAIVLFPVNMYGPGDNFDPEYSHVIPALIRKVFEAKQKNLPSIEVWGDGSPTRGFIYVEDAADAIVRAVEKYDKSNPVNIGSPIEISIKELVAMICNILHYKGGIVWNIKRPNGQPRRCLDISRAQQEFGFTAKTSFKDGLKRTIEWFEANQEMQV